MRIGEWYQPKKAVRHVETRCDICGGPCPGTRDSTEVTVGAKVGDNWPEGDDRVAHEIDVCFPCWRDKVRPAIEALGGKFRERNADDWTDAARYQEIREG